MTFYRRTLAVLLAALLAVDVAVIGAVHRHDHGSLPAAVCHAHLHVAHGPACNATSPAHQHHEQPQRGADQQHDDDCVVCRHLMQLSLPHQPAAILPTAEIVRLSAPARIDAPFAPLVAAWRTRAPPLAV